MDKARDFFDKAKGGAGMTIAQILIGLVIVYLIYIITMVIMKTDKLSIDEKFDVSKKRATILVDGYVDASSVKKKIFPTQIPQHPDYKVIQPSVNLRGGAQFSYSFWMYVGAPDQVLRKCIFLKGDSRLYDYNITEHSTNVKRAVRDRVAYCPMMSFGNNPMEFTLKFNTLNKMDEILEVRRLPSDSVASRQNLLSLFSKKWVMITIVFEDNVPINEFENGLLVKFYVNDILYQSGRYNSAIKQNNGDFVLFPDDTPLEDCKIGNLTYHNYAMGDIEIRAKANVGPPKKLSTVNLSMSPFISPSMISDYNRLDIYNA